MHRTCTIWIGVERNHTVVSLYKGPDSVSTGNSQFSDGFPLTVFREYSFIYSFQFLEDRREIGKGNGDGFLPVHAHTPVGGQSGEDAEVGYEVLCRRHHRRRLTAAAAGAGPLSPDVLPADGVADDGIPRQPQR